MQVESQVVGQGGEGALKTSFKRVLDLLEKALTPRQGRRRHESAPGTRPKEGGKDPVN